MVLSEWLLALVVVVKFNIIHLILCLSLHGSWRSSSAVRFRLIVGNFNVVVRSNTYFDRNSTNIPRIRPPLGVLESPCCPLRLPTSGSQIGPVAVEFHQFELPISIVTSLLIRIVRSNRSFAAAGTSARWCITRTITNVSKMLDASGSV